VKSELTGRIIMVLVILAVLATAVWLSGPKPAMPPDAPPQHSQITPKPSDRPLTPAEEKVEKISSEYPVTFGVIVGATAVLLIIVVGTLIELRRKS